MSLSRCGISLSPKIMARLPRRSLNCVSLAAIVAYRFAASLDKAVFSSHALLAVATASPIIPDARDNAWIILLWRIPDIPSSSSMAKVSPPSSRRFDSPVMKLCKASIGLVFHACANSSALCPAILANSLRFSFSFSVASSFEKSLTAACMFLKVVAIAVPPASASMPADDMAAASANISCVVNPEILPADVRRVAILVISDSEVAKLFPRSTTTDPSLSILS